MEQKFYSSIYNCRVWMRVFVQIKHMYKKAYAVDTIA
jgi:hypothetical protein